MNCRTSVQLVGSLLKERTTRLTEMNVADERALVLLWEELYWLLKICGHLLTEVSDDGEAPSIPYAVNVLAAQDGGAQMLGELFSIISSLVEWEGDVLRNQMSGIGRCLSPLFSKTLVWFLHRCVVILPEENFLPCPQCSTCVVGYCVVTIRSSLFSCLPLLHLFAPLLVRQ